MIEPPRKRLQMHLSTAVVTMFVAGALIGMDVCGQRKFEPRESVSAFFANMGEAVFTTYGWPFETVRIFNGYSKCTIPLRDYFDRSIPRVPDEHHYLFAVVDALVALAIVFAVWFVCEWLILRRAVLRVAN